MPTATELKLEEASIQLRLAARHPLDGLILRSCVNAFMAHGRSVTLVMQAESASIPGLTEWYETERQALTGNPICRFFKEARNITIHQESITPEAARVPIVGARSAPTSPGEPLRYDTLLNSPLVPALKGEVVVGPIDGAFVFWSFKEAAEFPPDGPNGVFRLCRDYLFILEEFVRTWLAEKERRRSAV